MSFSDSDSSSYGGATEYKIFRQISRDRLLYEMLGSTKTGDSKSTWKVLIMDKVTVKVMSHSCNMADITDQGVSLVEDLFRRRQPLPSMDVIYFIQPSKENVVMFLSDMSGREPLYKKAFVFFSSPIPKELVNHIKSDTSVVPRIGALREMNLEYFPIDNQAFITDHDRALEELFGDVENPRKFEACLNVMATRLATVFASLKELPFVRFRTAKALDDSPTSTFRDLVPTKLAAAVWNCISMYKSTIPNFPQTETCELLILGRSVDQIAPVIHEWTYDAMCHDLLDMDGNKYTYEVPSKTGGQTERKEVLMEDHDPIWLELRHAHIADASERLHEKMTNFVSKNKAAQIQQSGRDGSELSTRDLQKMVQALPQYTEQVEKISLHVELARLSREDMKVVNNMQLIGGSSDDKKTTGSFSLKFNTQKTKQATRKDRSNEEETWQLSRFYPMVEELIENLSKGELPKNEFSCINEASPTVQGDSQRATQRAPVGQASAPHSIRSKRTANWAQSRHSDDGYSSDSTLRIASTDFKKMGRRIFVFIIGGATRSELRVCHKLTTKLRREVVLGSSSIDDPPQYITKLKLLSERDLSMDNLKI
ncbi:hypothetical protein F2P56_016846 [Juglans regia]|uniref:Protein transport Sec1a-like n=1 Tax=Juglans regia TaxID=51240 RepID=A0A833XJ13_JUGRE|nr:hypothetical protein F2P56_016846 [Juglans regia]